jgi:choline dehydrogenase-like flavoprotein
VPNGGPRLNAFAAAALGADGDLLAVTDNQARVRGVEALRVVNASIFPLVPAPTRMLS